MPKLTSVSSRRGFSLIELLLVVSLIMVIGLATMPFMGRFINQNAVAHTIDQVTMSFRKAQFYAMTSRKSNLSGWGVHYASNTLTLYQGSSFAARNSSLDETFVVNSALTVTGLGDINFARLTGTPASTGTITVSGIGTTKTVTINSVGMVTR